MSQSPCPWVALIEILFVFLMDLLLGPHNIPRRELETSFHPLEAEQEFLQHKIQFIQWPLGTGGPECSSAAPFIEAVAQGTASAAASDVLVRDAASFIAQEPHRPIVMFGIIYLIITHRGN